jgi:hypothetical protein
MMVEKAQPGSTREESLRIPFLHRNPLRAVPEELSSQGIGSE